MNLDPEKLIVLFVIAMLILGPTRLPEAARTMGRWMAELRKYTSGFQKEFGDLLAEPREHTSALREELRNVLSEPRAAIEAGAREAQEAVNAASADAVDPNLSVLDPAATLPQETAGVQMSAVPDDPNLN